MLVFVYFFLFALLVWSGGVFLSPWPGGSQHVGIWGCFAVIATITLFLILSFAFGKNEDEEELETSPSSRDLPEPPAPPPPPPAPKKPLVIKDEKDAQAVIRAAGGPTTTTIARLEDLAPKDSGPPKRGYSWDGSAASVKIALKEFRDWYNTNGLSTMLTGKLLELGEGKCKLEGENGVTFTLESSEKNFKLELHVTERGTSIPLSETSRLKRFYTHEKIKDLNLGALQKIAEEIKSSIK